MVDKIAAQAALEVDHVHGASPGLAGSVFHADPTVGVTRSLWTLLRWLAEAGHEVSALTTARFESPTLFSIDEHLAQLRLIVEVDYPVSLRDVTRQLRTHVSERVRQLCDITVTDVDVRITALRYATEPKRRVL